MYYDMPLYRPPSEASSLILQVTLGCSHNACTFCSMYKSKKFRVKSQDEIRFHVNEAGKYFPMAQRVFLADGNVLAMDTDTLLWTLNHVRSEFPAVERISAYAGPKDLLNKNMDELKALRQAGLDMLYLGVESGSTQVLKSIAKGVSPDQMIEAGRKAVEAGFTLSCTIILGIGGKTLTADHARETARVINGIDPHYLGALTLMVEPGTPLYRLIERGQFDLLTPFDVLCELRAIIEGLELTNCIFRSNHASNYLVVKGTLNRDKAKMLDHLDRASRAGSSIFKPESWRGL